MHSKMSMLSKHSKVLIELRTLSRRRLMLRMVRNKRGDRNRARDVVDILIWKNYGNWNLDDIYITTIGIVGVRKKRK